jgi:hypothetical protein
VIRPKEGIESQSLGFESYGQQVIVGHSLLWFRHNAQMHG